MRQKLLRLDLQSLGGGAALWRYTPFMLSRSDFAHVPSSKFYRRHTRNPPKRFVVHFPSCMGFLPRVIRARTPGGKILGPRHRFQGESCEGHRLFGHCLCAIQSNTYIFEKHGARERSCMCVGLSLSGKDIGMPLALPTPLGMNLVHCVHTPDRLHLPMHTPLVQFA